MGFFRKLEDDIKELGRDFDDNVLQPIKENPVGAIVSIGGMALGIPPVYAGALGGAAGAAAGGGDILKGALVGGVTGYAGGAASSAAANAGAGAVLSGAAGGAAAGAAGAALTGGDIIKGALTGGLAGGAASFIAGQVNNNDGTYTRTNDDGSVIRYNSKGDILQVSPATDGGLAPVYDYNPSTGQLELVSGNGTPALNILDAEQTAALMKNIDPRLINNFADAGAGEQPFRVEVEGLPGTVENPGYANVEYRTPGTDLATFDQIDAGQASYNAAANAWEVTTPNYDTFNPTDSNYGAFGENPTFVEDLTGLVTVPTAPTPVYDGPEFFQFDDGSTLTIGRDGIATSTDAFGNVFTPGSGTAYASDGGGTTYRFDDGSWMTINPDGSSVVADSNGQVSTHAGGTYTGAGSNGAATDLGEITITAPRLTDTGGTGSVTDVVVTTPVTTTPVTTTPVTTTPGTIDYNPVNTPTPGPVVFPVLPPAGDTGNGGGGTTGGGTRTPGGPIQNLKLPPGLQPGFMNPQPFYNTTSPVQSQFSWGARDMQTGSTFDPVAYNRAPAPQTPWGLQNMAQPLTPEEIKNIYQGGNIVRPPLPVATRVVQPRTNVLTTIPATNIPTATTPVFTPQQIANTPGLGSNGIGINIQPLPTAPGAVVVGPSPFVAGPVAPR